VSGCTEHGYVLDCHGCGLLGEGRKQDSDPGLVHDPVLAKREFGAEQCNGEGRWSFLSSRLDQAV
jgi:hypothetical protein